jgi:hypothetical protein
MSESTGLSARFYFSYYQFLVFDGSVKRPGCAWTEAHFAQGFARRRENVSFRTLLEFGYGDLAVRLGPYAAGIQHERVIEVPLEVRSGEIMIAGPEEMGSEQILDVPIGHYRLTAAQRVSGDDREVIDLYLEWLAEPITRSRIIVADDALRPPSPLVESVDVA